MGASTRILVFAAAILFGVLVGVVEHNVQWLDTYLHASRLRKQDWLCLLCGPPCVLAGIYGFTKQSDTIDWRWGIPLALGVAALYAEFFDVTWLKDTACLFLQGRHDNSFSCFQSN